MRSRKLWLETQEGDTTKSARTPTAVLYTTSPAPVQKRLGVVLTLVSHIKGEDVKKLLRLFVIYLSGVELSPVIFTVLCLATLTQGHFSITR